MGFVIKKLIVFSGVLKKSFEYEFNSGFNIVTGGNKSGKSCIAKSIMYALGCDVEFEQEWIELENSYLIFFEYDDVEYSLYRQNLNGKSKKIGANYFILSNTKTHEKIIFKKVTELATFFNRLFNYKIKLKSVKDGELTQIFPNHMFLLNYIDQDTSWGTLLNDTYNNLNFLSDYKNAIIEYMLGFRNNEYYELVFKKEELQSEINEINRTINSLKEIRDKNDLDVNALEDINIDEFKKSYNALVDRYSSILRDENEFKLKNSELLSQLYYFENKDKETSKNIKRLKEKANILECPTCKRLYDFDVSKNYKINTAIFELEKILKQDKLNIDELKYQIQDNENQLFKIEQKIQIIESKFKDKEYKIEFIKKASDLGLKQIINTLNQDILKEEEKLDQLHKRSKEINKQLKAIGNDSSIYNQYITLMKTVFSEFKLLFIQKESFDKSFLNFRYNFSGTDKIKSLLSFYIVVNYMLNTSGKRFPFIIDTPMKEDFDADNYHAIITLILKYFNTQTSQQCFIFSSSNPMFSNEIENLDVNKIILQDRRSLFKSDLDEMLLKYENNINL